MVNLKEFMRNLAVYAVLASPIINCNNICSSAQPLEKRVNHQANYTDKRLNKKTLEKDINSSYTISKEGLYFIKYFEGLEPRPKPCPAGKLTVGYGHVIRKGEKYTEITKKEAEEILNKELEDIQKEVKKNVKVPLNQMEYDALVSFTFNEGPNALKESRLLRELNSGNYIGAAKEFRKWTYIEKKVRGKRIREKCPGLIRRRLAEEKLFLNDSSVFSTLK